MSKVLVFQALGRIGHTQGFTMSPPSFMASRRPGNPRIFHRPGAFPFPHDSMGYREGGHMRNRMADSTGGGKREGAATITALIAAMLAAMLAVTVASCSAPPPPGLDMRRLEPPVRWDVSMVVGYLDMDLAPTRLEWLEMRRISPPGGARFYQMRIHQGIFYMEKFPPGVYELNEFGGQGILRGQRVYRLPRQSPSLRIEIPAPGIYFLGAWRYQPGGGPSRGGFTLDRIEEPRQSEIVERLLPFAEDTEWRERLRKRLEDLQRKGVVNRPGDSGPRIDGKYSS